MGSSGAGPNNSVNGAGRWILPWFGVAGVLFVIGVISRHTTYDAYDILSKAAELLVLGAGLFSVLLVRDQLRAQEQQLRENHQQLVDDHKWKTIISYHQLFSKSIPPEELREKVYKLATEEGFIHCFDDLGTSLPEPIYQKCVVQSSPWIQIIRPYLDAFEEFSGAVNAGIVNESYAMSLQFTRVVRNFTVFERLIRHFQECNGRAYVEFEKLCARWSIQRQIEESSRLATKGVGAEPSSKIRGPNSGPN